MKNYNNTSINDIYNLLKEHIGARAVLQDKKNKLWYEIKRYGYDRSEAMDYIDSKIGECTHNINIQIGKLCQFKQSHRAMNLAHDYLTKEISRMEKIINKTSNTINSVKMGRSNLINSRGYYHTDTTNLSNYLTKKRGQLVKLREWLKHVSRYLV